MLFVGRGHDPAARYRFVSGFDEWHQGENHSLLGGVVTPPYEGLINKSTI